VAELYSSVVVRAPLKCRTRSSRIGSVGSDIARIAFVQAFPPESLGLRCPIRIPSCLMAFLANGGGPWLNWCAAAESAPWNFARSPATLEQLGADYTVTLKVAFNERMTLARVSGETSYRPSIQTSRAPRKIRLCRKVVSYAKLSSFSLMPSSTPLSQNSLRHSHASSPSELNRKSSGRQRSEGGFVRNGALRRTSLRASQSDRHLSCPRIVVGGNPFTNRVRVAPSN
jgi:hypothetical protein